MTEHRQDAPEGKLGVEQLRITEVLLWLKLSEDRFNLGLKNVAEAENIPCRERGGSPYDAGYQETDDGWIFTGCTYCSDGTMAYGIALQTQFPLLSNVQYLEIKPIRGETSFGIIHQVLKFSIGESDFFVDPTYGQIATKPNSLVVDRLENLEHHYKLAPYDHFQNEIRCRNGLEVDVYSDSDQAGVRVHKPEIIGNRHSLLDFHTCDHGAKNLPLNVDDEKMSSVVYLAGVLQGKFTTEENVSLAETDIDRILAKNRND